MESFMTLYFAHGNLSLRKVSLYDQTRKLPFRDVTNIIPTVPDHLYHLILEKQVYPCNKEGMREIYLSVSSSQLE